MGIKAVFILLLTVVMILGISGCKECISTEYRNVEVTVTDEYYCAARLLPMRTGKFMTTRVLPARYEITVEYEGVKYTFSGSETYNKYKDKVGQTVIGKLEIKTYDDGTVKYDILALE